MEQNPTYEVQKFEDFAMPVASVKRQVQTIQKVMAETMKDGEHYGKIPGCGDKKTLFKSGAEKLNMTFRLRPEYEIMRTELPSGHREYEITCLLFHIPTNDLISHGVGCCSTTESKYRYRNQERACPRCGKEAIIKGVAKYGGGWLCFAKKGGCGQKFKDGDKSIEAQNPGKVEYEDPADYYNTVLKMAKKRAHIDATLSATAASDIFSQDLEDEVNQVDAAVETEMSGGSKNEELLTGYVNKINSIPSLTELVAWHTKWKERIARDLSGPGELFIFNQRFEENKKKLSDQTPDPSKDVEKKEQPEGESKAQIKLKMARGAMGDDVYAKACKKLGLDHNAPVSDEDCHKVVTAINAIADEMMGG